MAWCKAHKPDGTEGTATLEMKYDEGKKEITMRSHGCIVKNDANLKNFIQNKHKPGADLTEFEKAKYYFYTCDSEFAEKTSIIKTATIHLYRFSKPNDEKKAKLNISPLQVVKAQKHVLVPCDCEEFKESDFLKTHSKKLQVPESLDAVAKKGKIYGLIVIEDKPKFIPLKLKCRQQSWNVFALDPEYYEQLKDAGPILLQDEKTVVGSYIKLTDDNRIAISVFGHVQEEDGVKNKSEKPEGCKNEQKQPQAENSLQKPVPGPSGMEAEDTVVRSDEKEPERSEDRIEDKKKDESEFEMTDLVQGDLKNQCKGSESTGDPLETDDTTRPSDLSSSDLACENESRSSSLDNVNIEASAKHTDTNTGNGKLADISNSVQQKLHVDGQLQHTIPDVPECTKEGEEHSLHIHVQEQAQAKVEPLVSDMICKREIMDRLSLMLNYRRNYSQMNWENLACELCAPPHIQAQCKRTTNESPTELLFESFKSWSHTADLRVSKLISILNGMERRDAVEIIEKHIPADKRENLVSDEITSDGDLMEELATKLDKTSKVLKNWQHLGLKLNIKREILQEIGNGNSPNAVEALFDHIYMIKPGFTVEEFKEKMEKISRIDVKDLLADITTGKMKDVAPPHSDLMCSICYLLNKSSAALKNWRHLASELGIDYNTYRSFEPETPEGPTSVLLEWAIIHKPNLTVRGFCKHLKNMKRYDAIEFLEKEFGQNFRDTDLKS